MCRQTLMTTLCFVLLEAVSVAGLAAADDAPDASGASDASGPRTFGDVVRVEYPDNMLRAEALEAMSGRLPAGELADMLVDLATAAPSGTRAPAGAPVAEEVVVGSRRFIPPEGLEPQLREQLVAGRLSGFVPCIIQFRSTPTLEEVVEILRLGVAPYFSVGTGVYVASVPAVQIEALAGRLSVRWVGAYAADEKISGGDMETIAHGAVGDRVPFYVWPLAKQDAARAPVLAALGVDTARYDPIPNVYVVEGTVSQFLRVAELDWVGRIELAKYISMCQSFQPDDSRELISTPDAWFAYDGTGVRIGVLDTGIWATHPDFAGAIAWQYDQATGDNTAPDDTGHGTHVAGIVAGRGLQMASGRGAAPGAQLYVVRARVVGFGSNIYGYDLGDAFSRFQGQSVPLVNNSWGTRLTTPDNPWNFGYDSACEIADSYTDNEGMTLVFCAGNEGPDPNTITEPGVAKNVITVGAVSYTDDGPAGGVGRIAGYSSRGPTRDDARLKPDVVAPGGDVDWPDGFTFGVVSCTSDPWDMRGSGWPYYGAPGDGNVDFPEWPADDHYLRISGTSMAAPHVTGIAALLYQAYGYVFQNDDGLVSRDIKALLVANALPIHQYGADPSNGYANTDTGYGLLDAYHTLFNVPQEKMTLLWAHGGVAEIGPNSQSWNFGVTSAAHKLVAVLCYEDDEGQQNDTDALIDDLDLTVTAPNGTQFTYTLPAGVTTESPLEKIVIDNPSAFGTGQWTATVTGADWGNPIPFVGSQRYTLVLTTYYVDPHIPSLSIDVPSTEVTLAPGDPLDIVASITNTNGLTAAGVTVTLSGDAQFGGDINKTHFVGNIIGRNSLRQAPAFSLTAPPVPGQYFLELTANAINRGAPADTIYVRVDVEGVPPDDPQPRVFGHSPVSDHQLIGRDASLLVYFSEPMNIASYNDTHVQVIGSSSGHHACTYALDGSGKQLTINPDLSFAAGEAVTVSFTDSIQSATGQGLIPYSPPQQNSWVSFGSGKRPSA